MNNKDNRNSKIGNNLIIHLCVNAAGLIGIVKYIISTLFQIYGYQNSKEINNWILPFFWPGKQFDLVF